MASLDNSYKVLALIPHQSRIPASIKYTTSAELRLCPVLNSEYRVLSASP